MLSRRGFLRRAACALAVTGTLIYRGSSAPTVTRTPVLESWSVPWRFTVNEITWSESEIPLNPE